jgi:amino acid/amide ABC transporter ATP-binding protein 1, HAAT family (TC 3.A.1.4.-)
VSEGEPSGSDAASVPTTASEDAGKDAGTDSVEAGMNDSAVEQSAKSVPSGVPLRVQNLHKRFGGITAVDGASFEIKQGSLTGLIGPNGAGKSTTFNCITGVHDPNDGRVLFRGTDITGQRPHEIAQQGLVRTFQITRELADMTVLENLMLAPQGQQGEKLTNAVVPGLRDGVKRDEIAIRERVWEMLELFEIAHLAEEYAGTLSGGQRKLLELARTLMTDPDVLLLDEPFAGVNPTLENQLLGHIHDLTDRGYTFLLVEHDMDLIMEHCEHIIVMHQGDVLAEGTGGDIQNNEQVIEAYLGESV